MTYDEWERTVPEAVKEDILWRVQAYRLASFLADCATHDVAKISNDVRFRQYVDQLCRASGSVAANIAEGYPSWSAKDRARFYNYALKSLAESKAWYLRIRTQLDRATANERFALISSLTRLLKTMIRNPRGWN